MKTLNLKTLFGTTAFLMGTATVAFGMPFTLQNLPTTIQGMSGGSQATANCGSIAAVPNAEINLTSASYLKLTAQAGGDPTLHIEGPLNLCVLDDKTSNKGLQTSGQWPAGTYRIYVGDRQGSSYPFTLSIEGSSN
jgi:hypothetical protein